MTCVFPVTQESTKPPLSVSAAIHAPPGDLQTNLRCPIATIATAECMLLVTKRQCRARNVLQACLLTLQVYPHVSAVEQGPLRIVEEARFVKPVPRDFMQTIKD